MKSEDWEQRQLRRFTDNKRTMTNNNRYIIYIWFIPASSIPVWIYIPDIEYYAHSKVIIGDMDKECPHCHTEKFKNEPAGTTFSWSVEQDIEKY